MKDPRDIFRQFSPQARKILTSSQHVAESMQSGIGSEHFLIALAVTPQTVAYELLKEYSITVEQIRLVLSLNNLWSRGAQGLSEEARNVIKRALRLAARYRHDQIEAEHLLLATTSLRDCRAYQVIARVGVDPDHLRAQLETMLGATGDLRMVIEPDLMDDDLDDGDHLHHDHGDPHSHHNHDFLPPESAPPPLSSMQRSPKEASKPSKGKLLDVFTIDLVAAARDGKLDPLIGREAELQRTMHVLARRTKNNPVLIGDPGVGKTAIVEGLAQALAHGQVPAVLEGRRILRLDLAQLVAGTMYRGQFEDRLKKIIDEVRSDPKIIMFVDELHTVVGTGSAEGSMDAANILKPALARGELRLIGATTVDEYRRFIERDPALERRFQPVSIAEPNIDQTRTILDGLKSAYEDYHRVRYTNEAIGAAAEFAERYITDRSLPDKAIDLLDEAGARLRLAEPNHFSRNLVRLEERLEQLRGQKERAIEREAFDLAARLRTKELKLRRQFDQLVKNETRVNQKQRPLVDRNLIASIVAGWTGIPRHHIIREKTLEITNLANHLAQRVVGQMEAVTRVSQAMERAAAGITPASRPLGSFLFLGPTGVGKTELARALAAEVFGTHEAFIKIDMSEFMERHSVSRLVGAPPGYVGYEDGGKLTDIVRRRPYALILMDEIEKAHPEVQHLLLQILEDGVLTDAKGRRISFTHTIFILTSNLGTHELTQAQAIGFQAKTSQSQTVADQEYGRLSQKVLERVRDFFQPEFLNRLDGTIIFRPLAKQSIQAIVDLRLAEFVAQLKRDGYVLEIAPAVRQYVAEHGFDPEYGARPIRRLITQELENPIARLILLEQLTAGMSVRAQLRKGQILLTTHPLFKPRIPFP